MWRHHVYVMVTNGRSMPFEQHPWATGLAHPLLSITFLNKNVYDVTVDHCRWRHKDDVTLWPLWRQYRLCNYWKYLSNPECTLCGSFLHYLMTSGKMWRHYFHVIAIKWRSMQVEHRYGDTGPDHAAYRHDSSKQSTCDVTIDHSLWRHKCDVTVWSLWRHFHIPTARNN